MIYAFNTGFENDASLVYEKNLLPLGVEYVELEEIPEKPDAEHNFKLKINPGGTGVFWEIDTTTLENLEIARQEKILLSKHLLADFLENNPLYSNAHNQIYNYYTVTEEKQTLLTSEFMGYQVMKNAGVETIITWNAADKPCEQWTEAEVIQLIGEMRAYVKPLITYQQKKELEIRNAKTKEELDNIDIDYTVVHENIIFNDNVTDTLLNANDILLVDDVK